jgi:hypothetical protein
MSVKKSIELGTFACAEKTVIFGSLSPFFIEQAKGSTDVHLSIIIHVVFQRPIGMPFILSFSLI